MCVDWNRNQWIWFVVLAVGLYLSISVGAFNYVASVAIAALLVETLAKKKKR